MCGKPVARIAIGEKPQKNVLFVIKHARRLERPFSKIFTFLCHMLRKQNGQGN